MSVNRFRFLLRLPALLVILWGSSVTVNAEPTHISEPYPNKQLARQATFRPTTPAKEDILAWGHGEGASVSIPTPYQWHTFYGPGSMSFDGDIAIGEDGSVYIAGQSDCWLGDGDTAPLHPCSGGPDIVVVKLDSHGAYQWHTFYGSDDEDYSYGITADEDGNLFIAGSSMYSWLGDDDAAPIHPLTEASDFVVVKLDGDGAYQWHTFYGSNDTDIARGIAVDGDGNVYITGQSQASWTGDGGATPLRPHNGGHDITTLKLDSQGAYQWHTFYGSSDNDNGRGIAVSGDGSVYISGNGYGSWLGDDVADPIHPYSGNLDIAILKLDSQGGYQWHTFYGSGNFDLGQRLAVLRDESVFVTGQGLESWKGDGGADPLHPHSGFSDIFVLKLDDLGAYQWHTFYGSAGRDSGIDISVAVDGRIYISGYSYASWLGDGDSEPLHPHSEFGDDIIVMRLDSSGAYQWHTFYGASGSYYGSHSDAGAGNAIARDGSVYTTGYSYASWLGDGDAGTLHSHSGFFDITVLKLLDEPIINELLIFIPLVRK